MGGHPRTPGQGLAAPVNPAGIAGPGYWRVEYAVGTRSSCCGTASY